MDTDLNRQLLSNCWYYSLGCFSEQAQRLAYKTSLAPRIARETIAQLHGFSSWSALCTVVGEMQDLALVLYREDEEETCAQDHRNNISGLLNHFSQLDKPLEFNVLERLLLADYTKVSECAATDNADAWEVYRRVKREFAYRTVWAQYGCGLSTHIQEIAVTLAKKLLKGIVVGQPPVATDREQAMRIVLDFYAGNWRFPDSGPIASFLDKPAKSTSFAVEAVLPSSTNIMRASSLVYKLRNADANQLDGNSEEDVLFALLAHAPYEAFIEKCGGTGLFVQLERHALVPDSSWLPQIAMISAGIPLSVHTITLREARDELQDIEKSGWLRVEFV